MRAIRSLLAGLVALFGHRFLLFPGAAGAWYIYEVQYAWQPGQEHMLLVLIGGWVFFNLVSARQLSRMLRPPLRLDKIEMPKAPPPKPAPAPVPSRAPKTVPVAPFIPGAPPPPQPTRVALLVEPASPAASPDEASMVAKLNPALQELMRRPS